MSKFKNFFRSLAAEFFPVARDGGSAFITTPMETITAEVAPRATIETINDGRVGLFDGGTLIYAYTNKAGAIRGAARRGLELAAA